jgi:hypothetical protein
MRTHPRLPVDLGTAAERTLKHFEQRFERTAGEVTRVEFQHLSARTDVLYLGLTFVLPEWYRILLYARAGDLEGVRRHLTVSDAEGDPAVNVGVAGSGVESDPAGQDRATRRRGLRSRVKRVSL